MNETILHRGTNLLLEREFVEADGTTPIPPANLVICEVELRQGERVVCKFVRGVDAALRTNAGGTAVELEITSYLSSRFTKGPIQERWRVGVLSASHTAEPGKSIKAIVVNELLCAG